jgi:hypothetical protein
MRALLALLPLLGGCTLLLSSSDHQGGAPAAQPDAAAPGDAGSDASDGGGDDHDAGACDLDRDGHRATGAACGGDDCDDSRDDVHPGALPICADGVVNDCSFRGEEALAAQLTGTETESGELGIVPPRLLGKVTSPGGVRTLAIAMASAASQGGGIWLAHLAAQDGERIPRLLHGSGDRPAELTDVSFPVPVAAFRDVTAVALGAGDSQATADFGVFASQPFDSDGDSLPDTRGWMGTLGPARAAGAIESLAPFGEPATYFPRAVVAGGSLQYAQHHLALLEARGTSHFMTAFRAGDASAHQEVRTDGQSIVARGGRIEAVGTRGAHLLLYEPGSSRANVWAYAANPGPLPVFNLSTLLGGAVTGTPGFAYLGRQSSQDQYALLAAGRGKVVAAVVSCPRDAPGSCALALDGTTLTIPLEHLEDEARAVAATTMRESALVAALTRVLANDSSDEHLDLTLLGLTGVMRTFTVFPAGFAGAGKRVLDAQIAAMRSALSRGGSATTIGYAALAHDDLGQDELHYGLMRACDAR